MLHAVSIESDADLEGLQRAGRVVALTLAETRRAVEPGVNTAELDAGARRPCSSAMAPARRPRSSTASRARSASASTTRPCTACRDLAGSQPATSSRSTSQPSSAATWRTPPSRCRPADGAARRSASQYGRDGTRGWHRRGARGPATERHRPRRRTLGRGCGLRRPAPLTGHGIGRTIHEAPDILNYDEPRNRGRLTPGLVITIEPIISARGQALRQDADGWTVRTRDGSLTAHAEHTVVVTRRGSPLVLTSGV